MEAKQSSQLRLELLAQKCPMKCKDAIDELSQKELTAILEALFDLVKEETLSHLHTQLLANFIMFFPQEDVFEFLQRLRTGELLQQFCRFFDEMSDVTCLVRMCKILLKESENNFLTQILMFLNGKTNMRAHIRLETLSFLANEITSPLRKITVELREKILNFLLPMGEKIVRVILRIRPTDPFDLNSWIKETRQIIENYKARQQRSE
jgi:hypothetical protein